VLSLPAINTEPTTCSGLTCSGLRSPMPNTTN
jgi:hypothetical protein